jgi:fluoroquinolone transport system permease protein
MNRLLATLRLDVVLQARSQLYGLGVFAAVVFGVLVRFLVPEGHVGRGLAAFYVLGVGGTTFMFGASMLLLERGQRTLEALRTSMVTTRAYVSSKVITLTVFAVVESAVVYAIASRGVATNFGWLLLGALVLGAFYTLVGLGLASAYDTVTSFLLPAGAAVAMVLQLPFLSLLGVDPWWVWYLVPTQAPLLLIQAAFEPIAAWQWAYAMSMSLAMLIVGWAWCRARFRVHVKLPEV